MSKVPISPWSMSAKLVAPNGQLTATIEEAFEVGMGAPTSGDLELCNGLRAASCNPSMVWSDDSRFLAVPQWTRDRQQRLLVLSMEHHSCQLLGGLFRVLELHEFKSGVILGVDSPVYRPQRIRLPIDGIDWAE